MRQALLVAALLCWPAGHVYADPIAGGSPGGGGPPFTGDPADLSHVAGDGLLLKDDGTGNWSARKAVEVLSRDISVSWPGPCQMLVSVDGVNATAVANPLCNVQGGCANPSYPGLCDADQDGDFECCNASFQAEPAGLLGLPSLVWYNDGSACETTAGSTAATWVNAAGGAPTFATEISNPGEGPPGQPGGNTWMDATNAQGCNSSADPSDFDFAANPDFTICGWAYNTLDGSNTSPLRKSASGVPAATDGWLFNHATFTTEQIQFRALVASAVVFQQGYDPSGSNNIRDRWDWTCIRRDDDGDVGPADEWTQWVNGVEQVTVIDTDAPGDSTDVVRLMETFTGRGDEFAVFSDALSDALMLQAYCSGIPGNWTDPGVSGGATCP